jgi:phage terminase small subunit
MAELINLRNARRRAQRRKDEREAEANRLMHGQPKHVRELRKAEVRKAARDLEARRIEREDGA